MLKLLRQHFWKMLCGAFLISGGLDSSVQEEIESATLEKLETVFAVQLLDLKLQVVAAEVDLVLKKEDLLFHSSDTTVFTKFGNKYQGFKDGLGKIRSKHGGLLLTDTEGFDGELSPEARRIVGILAELAGHDIDLTLKKGVLSVFNHDLSWNGLVQKSLPLVHFMPQARFISDRVKSVDDLARLKKELGFYQQLAKDSRYLFGYYSVAGKGGLVKLESDLGEKSHSYNKLYSLLAFRLNLVNYEITRPGCFAKFLGKASRYKKLKTMFAEKNRPGYRGLADNVAASCNVTAAEVESFFEYVEVCSDIDGVAELVEEVEALFLKDRSTICCDEKLELKGLIRRKKSEIKVLADDFFDRVRRFIVSSAKHELPDDVVKKFKKIASTISAFGNGGCRDWHYGQVSLGFVAGIAVAALYKHYALRVISTSQKG